ncbi:TonB-dependent receptor [Sphingomonas melonis]|uniref:Iron complex outermembrane receptor protein n=1 Tax=Sphingomonas melonis TaxID=152682 RepID=A0A7Y9FKX3_9SPHN|nr:TonB-dependent receptor plug domain-containing protein [Sphingomonas melonis]NYD89144.1 iron complex outermembrane receptor protein [Sphingomonas melonis]
MKASAIIKLGVSAMALACAHVADAQTANQGTQPLQSQDETPIAPPQQQPDVAGTVPDSADIVVTATRRSQTLQDVPISINVATGEQLEKLNILDARDIGRLAPGLEVTNPSGRSNAITLRGIAFDPDQGTSPAVQTYLNEVPTSAQTLFTALYDIGQIEVLRGAQGLLRGLSAPAGAITITTRRPDFDKVTGYGQITGTNRHGYNAQMGVGLPFSDTFAIRVAALVDGNRLNQLRNFVNGDHSNSETQSGRITLGWRPSDRLTAYLTYQYLESDNRQYSQVFGPGNAPALGDPTRSGPPLALDDYGAVQEGPARIQTRTHTVNLNANLDLGGATLTAVTGYQSSKFFALRDVDTGNAIPGFINLVRQNSPSYVLTGDLRLASKDSGFFGWSVGAFYQQQRGTTRLSQPVDSFFAPVSYSLGLNLPILTQIRAPAKADTYSFNANARFHVSDFTLEGGLRYTINNNDRVVDILVSSPGFAGAPAFGIPAIPGFSFANQGIPDELRNGRSRPLTGGATLTWEPSNRFTAYASYGRAFRQGSVAIGAPAGVTSDLLVSGNETTDNFEIGIKGALLDRRVSYSVATFYQKFDGFLSRFAGIPYNCRDINGACSNAGPPVNNVTDRPVINGIFDVNYNGDATIKGVEATLDLRPTTFWDVGINAAYSHARYDKGTVLPCVDNDGNGIPGGPGQNRVVGTRNVSYCSYSRLTDSPDFSLTATTELRLPTGGNLQPFTRGLLSYRPGVFSDRTNYDYPSRTLIDVFLGVRTADGRWEVSAFAKNVLNQSRVTFIYSSNSTATTSAGIDYDSGYRNVSVTNPREFGLTSAFRF